MVMLKVNNLTISVANAKLTGKREEIGGARRWSGRWGDQRRDFLRSWEIETTPQTMDVLERWKHWIMGRGHHWSFDTDLYSDKGLGVNTYSAGAPSITTGTTKFSEPGTAFAFIGSAGNSASWVVPLDGPDLSWTVSRWMWVNTDNPWKHLVDIFDAKTSTQSFYKSNAPAVVGSVSNYVLAVVNGSLQYTQFAKTNNAGANDSVWIEDLVIAPYAWDATMVDAVATSSSTQAFGPCPSVRVTGDLIEEAGPIVCRARVKRRPFMQGQPSGSWLDNMGTLVFELHEE